MARAIRLAAACVGTARTRHDAVPTVEHDLAACAARIQRERGLGATGPL